MLAHSPRTFVATIFAAALVLASPVGAQDSTMRVAVPATATTPVPRLRGMARFGLENGGDKVVQFEYADGSTPDVTAGGGLHVSLGAALRMLQARAGGLDAQLGVGLKYRTIPPATNQDATWLRVPIDGLLMFRSARGFGVGAGATVHVGNALRTSGEVSNARLEFDSSPGVLVQAEYAWRGAIFDLRYTALEYTLSGTEETVDASSVGIGIGFMFGRHGIVR
jgi:hypothetical protein